MLRSRHRATPDEVRVVVEELASDPCFAIQDSDAVWLALEMSESVGADFADALIAALSSVYGCTHGVTFDKAATRLPGMRLLPAD